MAQAAWLLVATGRLRDRDGPQSGLCAVSTVVDPRVGSISACRVDGIGVDEDTRPRCVAGHLVPTSILGGDGNGDWGVSDQRNPRACGSNDRDSDAGIV